MGYLRLIVKRYVWFAVPLTGLVVGNEVEKYYDRQMTLFRDMSALYGSEKAEGEPPSW